MQRPSVPLSRIVSRLVFVVLVCAPLLGGISGCGSAPNGLSPTITLTFHSLSTKTLPAVVEDDGDTKDVTVKDRVKFKPSVGTGDGLEKRLRLKSKTDGGGASVAGEVQMTGDVSSSILVAADSLEGLVDGVSLGFLERRAANDAQVARLVATWNAGIDGFTVSGSVDGTPLETTVDLPGEHQVSLRLVDVGAQLLMQGAGEGTPTTLGAAEQDGSTDTGDFAFGAEGLGVKGTLWFGDFKLTFPATVATGEAETEIAGKLAMAWYYLDLAEPLVLQDPPHNMDLIYNYLGYAAINVGLNPDGAAGLLQAAVDADSLLPTTNGVLAAKKAKTAAGWVVPAWADVFNLIQKDKTSAAPVKSHIKIGKKNIELAMAMIHGFQSKSHGKLLQTVEVTVE